jgi:hypothetical protein
VLSLNNVGFRGPVYSGVKPYRTCHSDDCPLSHRFTGSLLLFAVFQVLDSSVSSFYCPFPSHLASSSPL